jgi:hypothetical protein
MRSDMSDDIIKRCLDIRFELSYWMAAFICCHNKHDILS